MNELGRVEKVERGGSQESSCCRHKDTCSLSAGCLFSACSTLGPSLKFLDFIHIIREESKHKKKSFRAEHIAPKLKGMPTYLVSDKVYIFRT